MGLNCYLGGVVSDVGTRDSAGCQLPRRSTLVWSPFCSACLSVTLLLHLQLAVWRGAFSPSGRRNHCLGGNEAVPWTSF